MKLLKERYRGKGRPRKVDYDTIPNRWFWKYQDALSKPLVHHGEA